jgi:DMSO/TMAO reductase YedYZ heme-binding membrane subunit
MTARVQDMTSELIWYTARASGIVTWILLAASVVWGLALTTKVLRGRPRPAWILDLHRFLGATAPVFLTIHVTSIMLDSYVHFGIVEVLVPFTGSWHPGAVAWGIAALYLLVAVEVTSKFRARLPKRVWRSTHYLSFPLLAVATVHGLTAGTDRHNPFVLYGMLGVTSMAGVLTAYRVVGHARGRPVAHVPVSGLIGEKAA